MFAQSFISWLLALWKPKKIEHPTPFQQGFADYENGQHHNRFPDGSPQSEEWKRGRQEAWHERQW